MISFKEMNLLLNRYWILKEEDKDAYFAAKDAARDYKELLQDKLGYRLIQNPSIIRLEKLPGIPQPWMGISAFEDLMDYGMFCVMLAYLEERGPGDQFVLSQLTEAVQELFPAEPKPDWTLFRHRRSLVRVLRFAEEQGMLVTDDGDSQRFSDTAESEVLYRATGASRYFMRYFTGNVLDCNTIEDLVDDESLGQDQDRGRFRKYRVYRRLLMEPAVYSEFGDDGDMIYIKNFRAMLQKDVEQVLDGTLEIYRNCAWAVPGEAHRGGALFPDTRALSDIVLHLAGIIRQQIASGGLRPGPDERMTLSQPHFIRLLGICRSEFGHGWSKEYREADDSKLSLEVMAYMRDFGMVSSAPDGRELTLLPLLFRFEGKYPAYYAPKENE